jgi:hypothetical protein
MLRRAFTICLFLPAISACEDPETCPSVSPADAGASFAPIMSSGGSHAPPLQCAYLDSCGEMECTKVGDDWDCKRNPDWDNCSDASADADGFERQH